MVPPDTRVTLVCGLAAPDTSRPQARGPFTTTIPARTCFSSPGGAPRGHDHWAIELRHLLGRAIHLHQIRETLTPSSFTLRRRRIENAVDRLVLRTFLPNQPDTTNTRRFQSRYREHRASLFVFFDRPDVPPTNNASEQDLRPSVIHRTVTGGYRSWVGAEVSAILTSLFTTAHKQGQSLLDHLRSTAGPSRLAAAGVA